MVEISVHGETRELETQPDTALLWLWRDSLWRTGTGSGDGIALCGAGIAPADSRPLRSQPVRLPG